MTASGQLEKVGRGLSRRPDSAVSEHETLTAVATRAPQAVSCLLTALQIHELTTQMPRQVWITMPRGSPVPKIDYPPLRMIQATDKVYSAGIETVACDRVPLRVYSAPRTVVDCFKHRNTVGLDVALEVLRDAREEEGFGGRSVALRQALPCGERDALLSRSDRMSGHLAASVRARLLHLAKAQRADFNQLLIRFALERMLYRLSQSEHAERFLLKGALLFTLWYDMPHRTTRDADLLSFGASDLDAVARTFRDIAAIDGDDGRVFDPSSVAHRPVGGIRLRPVTANLVAGVSQEESASVRAVARPPARAA